MICVPESAPMSLLDMQVLAADMRQSSPRSSTCSQ
jgi:hypothetical protein